MESNRPSQSKILDIQNSLYNKKIYFPVLGKQNMTSNKIHIGGSVHGQVIGGNQTNFGTSAPRSLERQERNVRESEILKVLITKCEVAEVDALEYTQKLHDLKYNTLNKLQSATQDDLEGVGFIGGDLRMIMNWQKQQLSSSGASSKLLLYKTLN
jgi:hypothetical protein